MPRISCSAGSAARLGAYNQFALPLHLPILINGPLSEYQAQVRRALGSGEPTANHIAFLDTFRMSRAAPYQMQLPGATEKTIVTFLADAVQKELRAQICAQVPSSCQGDVQTMPSAGVRNALGSFTLATAQSEPEPCVMFRQFIIAGREDKGWGESLSQACAQCFQICSDGAVAMHEAGVGIESCVVPGVVCAGGLLQVLAVYLVESCFPCAAALSPPIGYMDDGGIFFILQLGNPVANES